MYLIHELTSFAIASFALAISPGPSWIYIISSTVEFGKKAGIIAMLGNSTGILFHTFAVSFGLSALVFYSPTIYSIIKWFGVFYLAYLAVRILLNRKTFETTEKLSNRHLGNIYKSGVLVNLLNPKAILLMFALLPQFVNPQAGQVTLQMLLLGLIHVAMAALVLSVVCFTTSKISGAIDESWLVQKLFRWVSATLLLVFAIKLALID